MKKTVAIVQPSYIPWKGYFDLIASVDEFILLDDVQYTRRDWRNRNAIPTSQGLRWLTVPVRHGGRVPIDHIRVCDAAWAQRHLAALERTYARAPYFAHYRPWLAGLYARARELELLAEIDRLFLTEICRALGIVTRLVSSRAYPSVPGKTERLVALCRAAGASTYLSGPSARAYLQEEAFAANRIEVVYKRYAYAPYRQLSEPFEHHVSVLDLLFNAGPAARDLARPIS